jgi:hypothetical protein
MSADDGTFANALKGFWMRPRWLLAAAGLSWIVCAPLAAQEKSLPQQIADVMVQLNGGVHPGFRFAHAKGMVLTGTFTPAKGS